MGKKLAIRGHSTRGKEVIELLEMMGGVNSNEAYGNLPNNWDVSYYIFKDGVINVSEDKILIKKQFEIFTLEEFLEKYPYKVGDKIPDVWGNSCTVKSMSWDENYKTVMYGFEETVFVVRGDELYMTNIINNHTKPSKMKNVLAEILEHIKTTPKEELEREFEEIKEWSNVGPTIEEFMTFCECVNKKPKYPTTYDKCCDILNADEFIGYEFMLNFPKLINARNAYWKIYGEQMGLGKPWNPKFGKTILFSIKFYLQQDSFVLHKGEYSCSDNCILVFPTAEMRDAFYENFKDLIEQCKELL